MDNQIALISGRFDPPHPGHLINLKRIAQRFNKVIVVILDYEDREYPATYCKQIIDEDLLLSGITFETLINTIHFGKLKQIDLGALPKFDVYFAGNMAVLKNMEKLCKVEWIDRAYHYEATDDRIAQGVKRVVQ